MTTSYILRGVAIPFGKTRDIGNGVIECIEPDAFSAMLRSGRRVPVLWGSHHADALILTAAAMLFADAGHLRALAFEGRVESTRLTRMALAEIVRGRTAECSINFRSTSRRPGIVHGMACSIVTAAEIDHVAVVDSAAYGPMTAAWRSDDGAGLEDAPYAIRLLDEKFKLGLAASRASTRREAAAATARARRLAPVVAFLQGDRSFPAMLALANFRAPLPSARQDHQ